MSKTTTTTEGGAEARPRTLFNPGVIVVTRGVHALMDEAKLEATEVCTFIGRHLAGDWGELDRQDRGQNKAALETGGRLFSAYRSLAGERFWVITDAVNDKGYRASTCVLLPDEY